MNTLDSLEQKIRNAFSATRFPGKGKLTNSYESEESSSVETEFAERNDWKTLTAEFLDQAPQGYSSALSFFSHSAFIFYLPAYMIADIRGSLKCVDVLFPLYHGLETSSAKKRINPQRYGEETWFDYATERFRDFSTEQAAAVVAYLEFKSESCEFERQSIREAIDNYWGKKAA